MLRHVKFTVSESAPLSVRNTNVEQSRTQSRTQSLLASYSACSTKTKGSGKDLFLGDPDWSSEM